MNRTGTIDSLPPVKSEKEVEVDSKSKGTEKLSMMEYAQKYKDILSLKPHHPKRYSRTVFMSIDAEWFQMTKYRNQQLSWQTAVMSVSENTGKVSYKNSILYIKDDQRLTFPQVIEIGLLALYPNLSAMDHYYFSLKKCKKALKKLEINLATRRRIIKSLKYLDGREYTGDVGVDLFKKELEQRLSRKDWNSVKTVVNRLLTVMPLLIYLIAHFSVAEWSMFADRDSDELLSHLQSVRKTFYSSKPFKLTLDSSIQCEIHWFDTELLAPAGFKKLEKLAELLPDGDVGKIKLQHNQISRMDKLLAQDPLLFKNYALRDTEITLKLFLTIQGLLNDLTFGAPVKLFRTIGSASVRRLMEFEKKNNRLLNLPPKKISDNTTDHELKKQKEHYYRHLSFARACYHGGRNEGFFRGKTEDYSFSKYRIYLDLDFASCYPTAMVLIPRIDLSKEPKHTKACFILTPEIIVSQNLKITVTQEKKLEELYHKVFPWDYRQHWNKQRKQPENPKENGITKKSLVESLRDIFGDSSSNHVDIGTIVQQSLRHNNSLIEKWYLGSKSETEAIKKAAKEYSMNKNANPHLPKLVQYQIMGFARVVFLFPSSIQFPCLPIRHVDYGLICPLSGESYATAAEIILAQEMIEYGNQFVDEKNRGYIHCLEAVEMIPMSPAENDQNKVILEYFTELVKEREKYKNVDHAKDRFLKEYILTVYGKTAQAISPRSTYNIKTGENTALPYSPISEAYIASLTTGLPRAALSAILFSVERFNRDFKDQIVLISCTTDGLLLGFKPLQNFKLTNLYDKKGDPISCLDALKRFPSGVKFYERLLTNLSLLQLKYARSRLSSSDYIEIKHIATELISVKTRGQIGYLTKKGEGEVSIIARFGHKPPEEKEKDYSEPGLKDKLDAKWLIDQYDDQSEDINSHSIKILGNAKMILDPNSPVDDLISIVRKRNINTDWDWKRKLIQYTGNKSGENDTSKRFNPISQPFVSFEEMLNYRKAADKIRRRGKKATPDLVTMNILNPTRVSKMRGSIEEYVLRSFLRGLLQGYLPVKTLNQFSYKAYAEMINQQFPNLNITETHLKNAKRGFWESNIIPENKQVEKQIKLLCEMFDVDIKLALEKLIVKNSQMLDRLSERVISTFFTAVIKSVELNIAGFKHLQISQKPTSVIITKLQDILTLFPTKKKLSDFIEPVFIAKQIPRLPETRKLIDKLLRRVVVVHKQLNSTSEKTSPDTVQWSICKEVIFQPQSTRRNRKNPAQLKCLKDFTQAVSQHHVCGFLNKTDQFIIQRLHRFGMNRSLYYRLKKTKFTAHSIQNETQNKRTIKELCKVLDADHNSEIVSQLLLENKTTITRVEKK
jgi:hypothetical protein